MISEVVLFTEEKYILDMIWHWKNNQKYKAKLPGLKQLLAILGLHNKNIILC